MISAIELKRCVISIGIFGVVVGKLCYEKKSCSIILFEVDKSLKRGFHCTILPFGLTVCLWIKNGRKSLLDAEEIT